MILFYYACTSVDRTDWIHQRWSRNGSEVFLILQWLFRGGWVGLTAESEKHLWAVSNNQLWISSLQQAYVADRDLIFVLCTNLDEKVWSIFGWDHVCRAHCYWLQFTRTVWQFFRNLSTIRAHSLFVEWLLSMEPRSMEHLSCEATKDIGDMLFRNADSAMNITTSAQICKWK